MLTQLLAALSLCHVASAGPVRVFVLAGQSNTVGNASMVHLRKLVSNTTTSQEFAHLWTGTNWTQRDDVFVRFEDRYGNLTAGFGYPGEHFGPELEFGWTVGDALEEKVLLIKTSWGGKALAVEFRPPSSGIGNFSNCDPLTNQCVPYRPSEYGSLYRLMVEEVFDTLANLERYVPGYNKSDGFIISGFVWFQGWQDHLDWNKIAEYKTNLINLIHNIRADLYSPNLPVIIGELGTTPIPGYDDDKIVPFRQIQEEVANMEEFRDKARFVKTSTYVIADEERYDGVYHYWGRADTFIHIGRAFGQAMLGMLGRTEKYLTKAIEMPSWINSLENETWIPRYAGISTPSRIKEDKPEVNQKEYAVLAAGGWAMHSDSEFE